MSDDYYEKTAFSKNEVDRFFLSSGINRFGERLKKAMINNGIKTNTAMAFKCGMSETVIRNYVNGRTYPTLDRLAILAMACNCSVNYLTTGEGQELGIEYKNEKTNINDELKGEPLSFMLSRLDNQEKELMVNFIQREGLNSLLRLISGRPVSHHKPQPLDFLAEFLDGVPDVMDDNPDPNAPWVDEEGRAKLKEYMIEQGYNRERISSLIMLFSLPAQEAREILAEYTSGKRANATQGVDFTDREKKAKGG